jgi:hypothetical protein
MPEYTCPQCRKTLVFPASPPVRKRQCPHCGRDIMMWDSKPEIQQHGGKADHRLVIVAAIITALGVAACVFVYFYNR